MTCAPTIARGVAKTVAIGPELVCWGTPALANSARYLRRVTAAFNLTKDTYQSNEIRVSQQVSDMRHGTRSVTGTVNGELSAGSYYDLIEAILGRDFASTSSITGLTVNIVDNSDGTYNIVRSTGTFAGSGVTAGSTIRLTAGADAGNLDRNLLVLSINGATLVVKPLDSTGTLTEETAVSGVTVAIPGKSTYAPLSSHTDKSFTVEEGYTDIDQYERYDGLKVNSLSIALPATGLATIDIGMTGKDMGRSDTTAYFTSPTAQSTTGVMAAVNGLVVVDGAPVALITSADVAIERATENAQVVGSNSIANVFTGRITASGNMSLYFIDGTLRDKYVNEERVSVIFTLTEGNGATDNVLTIAFPSVKFGSWEKADAENGIVASVAFTALENSNTSTGLVASTVFVHDTSLS